MYSKLPFRLPRKGRDVESAARTKEESDGDNKSFKSYIVFFLCFVLFTASVITAIYFAFISALRSDLAPLESNINAISERVSKLQGQYNNPLNGPWLKSEFKRLAGEIRQQDARHEMLQEMVTSVQSLTADRDGAAKRYQLWYAKTMANVFRLLDNVVDRMINLEKWKEMIITKQREAQLAISGAAAKNGSTPHLLAGLLELVNVTMRTPDTSLIIDSYNWDDIRSLMASDEQLEGFEGEKFAYKARAGGGDPAIDILEKWGNLMVAEGFLQTLTTTAPPSTTSSTASTSERFEKSTSAADEEPATEENDTVYDDDNGAVPIANDKYEASADNKDQEKVDTEM